MCERLKTPEKRTVRDAFTVIEIMIAVVVLFIAVIGTSANRYGAVMDARRADLQTNAVQTALLLGEGWDGAGANLSFKPVDLFGTKLDIIADEGPDSPAGFTALGSFKIVREGVDYYATLSWQDLSADLRALSVIVNWNPVGNNAGEFENATKSYRLTIYVENPV